MEIYLTDVSIANLIIANLTKSTRGDGKLRITLPKDYYVLIEYGNDIAGRLNRTISINSNAGNVKTWKNGDILLTEIEKCLDGITKDF